VVDSGKLTHVLPPPPKKIVQDPTLAPDVVQHTAFALDGGTTVVQRLVTRPNGKVTGDEIDVTYQPHQAVDTVGSAGAEPTATPNASGTKTSRSGARGGSTTPGPKITPTFNH
jgi:hypothetical protein